MSWKRRSLLPLAVGLTVGLVLPCALLLEVYAWRPWRNLRDLDYVQSATPEELRQTAHRVLALPFADDHDACFLLISVGNHDSLPYLERAIRRNLVPGGVQECTYSHCLDALAASRAR
jgi:hypothetical protein